MAADLIFAPETARDLAEAYGWYDNQQSGLGERFLTNANRAIEEIIRQPEAHRVILATYRRGLIRRFPYAIFYEVVGNTVTVYGIFHTASDPKKWRRRLP